jgi:hypothetical protein
MENMRRYFESRAVALADCADLDVTSRAGFDLLKITPHNDRALGVYLIDSGSHDCVIGIAHRHDVPDEYAACEVDVDRVLDPAVAGDVRLLAGPRRWSWQLRGGDGVFRTVGTHYEERAWLPLPGWRRRATIETFEPYRRL